MRIAELEDEISQVEADLESIQSSSSDQVQGGGVGEGYSWSGSEQYLAQLAAELAALQVQLNGLQGQ